MTEAEECILYLDRVKAVKLSDDELQRADICRAVINNPQLSA